MSFLKTALVCAFAALAMPTQAATVTLDFTDNAPGLSDGYLDNGDTVTSGDFSVTFQNVQTANGRRSPVSSHFGGLLISVLGDGIVTVDLIFNIDTIIDAYDVPGGGFSIGTFQLSGPNGTSGHNTLSVDGRRAFDMGSIPVFLAGETYTLSDPVQRPFLAELKALHVSNPPPVAAIPLPASLPLLLAGFGAIALLRRRA